MLSSSLLERDELFFKVRIKSLEIRNLRNHAVSRIEFGGSLNVIAGENGAGKTTILEAIAICAFSKSFLPASDNSLIKIGGDYYKTSLTAERDLGTPYYASVLSERGKRKRIENSFAESVYPKDLVGKIPTIILSPDLKEITFGGPDARRRFLDRILSQIYASYLEDLSLYKKSLRQRNKLLGKIKLGFSISESEINPWTENLIKYGSRIILKRSRFIEEFRPYFKKYYARVSNGKEVVDLEYAPCGAGDLFSGVKPYKIEEIASIIAEKFVNLRSDERARGTTLFGPQKDEVIVKINGGAAREYASQGQHKSILLGVKMAEFKYLKDKTNETPIMALDDVFSELDEERAKNALEIIIENRAQAFITTTDVRMAERIRALDSEARIFFVKNAIIKESQDGIV